MRQIILFAATFTALLASSLDAAEPKRPAATPKRAKPPDHWDQRVLDTFFPDARAALTGPRPQTDASASPKPNASQSAGAQPDPSASDADLSTPWSQLISAETLQDEIKSLAPLLAADVRTQQTFLAGGFKTSRRTLSVLAALFAIIHQYDADAPWKNDAAAARDLFARAAHNSKSASEQSFREVKSRADDLAALLRGQSISQSGAPPADQWDDVAERPMLMTRLELAQRDRITPGIANPATFKRSVAALQHEAEIVAAFAQVITQDGYEYHDDETYREYAHNLQRAALDLRKAAKEKDYPAARAAAADLGKACTACHGDFRG
jgi:hypothetical protein